MDNTAIAITGDRELWREAIRLTLAHRARGGPGYVCRRRGLLYRADELYRTADNFDWRILARASVESGLGIPKFSVGNLRG